MHKTTITIRETALGWLNKHTGRYHRAAVLAYNSVLRQDANALRKAGRNSITTIIWEPTTSAGLQIVRTLGGQV